MKSQFIHVLTILFCLISALVSAGNDSFEEIKRLAEQGDISAQFKLGVMYYKGQEISQNYNEALNWFKKAAEQGLSEAQYNLGLVYYEGKGISLNYTKALKWFQKAAEQGTHTAQFILAARYASGEVVPQNYIKAYAWTSLALSNGYELAKKNILILNKSMTASEMEKAATEAAKLRESLKK